MPVGESPLQLPANEHKQLVVIDFEYANANLPGLEFANHFVRFLLQDFPALCIFIFCPKAHYRFEV
jgi:Choline/ethanolamine kinase